MGIVPLVVRGLNRVVVRAQTGYLRWYVASMAIGAVLIVGRRRYHQ